MINDPSISVILPVYNSFDYISEAILSILEQTFIDFELIIIDDGSTDMSLNVILSFKDPRIIVLRNEANKGNYYSRNIGIRHAKGKYICIMDADDIALKNRFQRQFLFMETNPNIGLSGSGFKYIGTEMEVYRETNHEKIKVKLLRNNCFIHSSIIVRREIIFKYKLFYNEDYYYSSDYDLLVRAARFCVLTNMPEVLLLYRIHKQQISLKHRKKQLEYAKQISIKQLEYLDILITADEAKIYLDFILGYKIEYCFFEALKKILKKIIFNNRDKRYYLESELLLLYNSLFTLQPYYNWLPVRYNLRKMCRSNENQQNLLDITFIVKGDIRSPQQLENLYGVVNFISSFSVTNLVVLEENYIPEYVKDDNLIQTYKFVNCNHDNYKIIDLVNFYVTEVSTPYIVIWDSNYVVPFNQIISSIYTLRKDRDICCIPFNGICYQYDAFSSKLFKEYLDPIFLLPRRPFAKTFVTLNNIPIFPFNRVRLLQMHLAKSNENVSFNIDDAFKLMGLNNNFDITFSSGPIFKLWQPQM